MPVRPLSNKSTVGKIKKRKPKKKITGTQGVGQTIPRYGNKTNIK